MKSKSQNLEASKEPECDVDSADENTKPESQDSCQHSDDKADLFSYFRLRSFTEMITVGWISKIMRYTRDHDLKLEDFGTVKEDDSSKIYSNELKREWKEVKSQNKKFPLLRSMFSLYKWKISTMLIVESIVTLMSSLNLIIMREILGYIEGEYTDRDRAVMFVFIMVFFEFISRVLNSNISILKNNLTRRVNVSIMGLIYSKIYNISGSNKKYSKGTINNIINSDSSEVQNVIWMIPYSVSTPLSIIINCYTLYTMVGWAFMVAVLISAVLSLLTYFVSKYVREWYEKQRKQMDEKANYLNEMIENIKVIKINSWTDCFAAKIYENNKAELYNDFRFTLMWIPNDLIYSFGRYFLLFGVFSVLILYYKLSIGVAAALSIMKVIERIKGSLGFFSWVYRSYSKFGVSVQRIEDLLLCDEIEGSIIQQNNEEECKNAVEIKNSNFFWGFDHISDDDIKEHNKKKQEKLKEETKQTTQSIDESNASEEQLQKSEEDKKSESNDIKTLEERVVLKSIDLKIKKGEFVAIIGDVGSGKSSLLSCILGDMQYIDQSVIDQFKDTTLDFKNDLEVTREKAEMINKERKAAVAKTGRLVSVNGTMSLVEQKPFILNKTIRDNILFGDELDPDRYNHTVHICQLGRDLEILEGGDLTEIGERGINLSGGQKARVSIARAVYTNADIVLMDDPLSALDAHVKRKIFDRVCCKELNGKTRLLVTHAVDFLDRVDRIVVMDKGRIALDGTFDELKDKEYFKSIIKCMNKSTNTNSESASDKSESDKESDIEKEKDYMSKEGTKIIDQEDEEKIDVTFNSYKKYFRYMKKVIFIMIFCILINVIQNLLSLKKEHSILSWVKEFSQVGEVDYGSVFNLILLSCICIAIDLVYSFIRTIQDYIIKDKLFRDMLEKVMGASITLFFEKTPSGKIINRFGEDLSTANYISNAIIWYISNVCEIVMILAYVAYYVPTSLFIVPLTIGLFLLVTKDFIKVSKEIRRISRTVYSPIYTHMSESIDGISTIRTYKKTSQFEDRYCELQDKTYVVDVINSGIYNWLSFRLNLVSIAFIAYYYINCIYTKDGKDPVLIALMIGYLTSLQWRISSIINDLVWIDGNMVSFERCLKILESPQEAEQRRQIPTDENNQQWMSKGHIKFNNYSVKYRPDTEVVIKDLSVDIKPGEKIGIVGRTGSGKSTLCLSLCRVLEAFGGNIEIDGVDISTVGLSDLRDRITVIPQEPVLFNSTLRFNLDPENKISDKEVVSILEKACLKDLLTRDGNGLDFKITEKGSNLSAGEKALICICRAILRKNKIVVLDEATASIDINTEEIIQKLILEEFKESTVLTVAHRLNTIMHSDKIAVMNNGNITEFDTIESLKSNESSEFTELLNEFNK